MKVLHNNYKPGQTTPAKTVHKYTCPVCGSELEFDDEDMFVGAYGLYHIKCPCCDYDVATEYQAVELTADNVKFPIHYSDHSIRSAEIGDERVDKMVKDAINELKRSPGFYSYVATGDTIVFCVEEYGEYNIFVSKNYYETKIKG